MPPRNFFERRRQEKELRELRKFNDQQWFVTIKYSGSSSSPSQADLENFLLTFNPSYSLHAGIKKRFGFDTQKDYSTCFYGDLHEKNPMPPESEVTILSSAELKHAQLNNHFVFSFNNHPSFGDSEETYMYDAYYINDEGKYAPVTINEPGHTFLRGCLAILFAVAYTVTALALMHFGLTPLLGAHASLDLYNMFLMGSVATTFVHGISRMWGGSRQEAFLGSSLFFGLASIALGIAMIATAGVGNVAGIVLGIMNIVSGLDTLRQSYKYYTLRNDNLQFTKQVYKPSFGRFFQPEPSADGRSVSQLSRDPNAMTQPLLASPQH